MEPPRDPSEKSQYSVLADIFSKPQMTSEKINTELEANGVFLSHDLVLDALKNLQSAPDVARRLFDWVSEGENEKRLSSKSYNLMLRILVENGFTREFWDLVETMKKKGYGVSKYTFLKASEKLENDGLTDDVMKLNALYVSGSTDNSSLNFCSRVCRIIRRDVWGDNTGKKLRELNVEFSSDLISMILENLDTEDSKGFTFFRWIEESGLFRHDERTYNAMAKVLATEDSTERFWSVVGDMRKAGVEMGKDTYVKAMERFAKRKMIHDAVDLWEFAIGGINKPSVQDCTLLLKKIMSSKELNMDLFSRVVRTFKAHGNVLTDSTFEAILKSLTSVGRIGECNRIMKAMEVEGGFTPSVALQRKIAFHLSRRGEFGEAGEFMDNLDASDPCPDHKTWDSLVQGYCLAGDLSNASTSLGEMVEKVGVDNSVCALESVVSAYCIKNKAVDAFNLVSKMIHEKEVHPWHSTFKILVSKLLAQGRFKESLDVLPLMKAEGYPPLLDPFIEYLSKSKRPDDAMAFFEAMTSKKFPSTPVFLQLFEAYFKLGRNDVAQDLLLKCPRYVRNHADVLNLFSSKQSGTGATVADIAS